MASIKRGSAARSVNTDRVSKIKELIKSHATTYFATTLGLEKDIVNIVAALFYLESRFNYNSIGPTLQNKEVENFLNSSAVREILRTGTPEQKAGIEQARRVVGLGQVTGHYFIRRATPGGVGEIERLRPDLASVVCIEPGQDLFGHILGELNMSKAILGSMIILESKYKNVFLIDSTHWKTRGVRNSVTFPSKIAAAVGAYLGTGKADANGTTPAGYASSIVGGDMYAIANGTSPIIYNSSIRDVTAIANGPSTNGVNRAKITTAGCS